MASIVVVSGPNQGDYYPIGRRALVIGRDEACPVQIIDELVSRKHLQVRFNDQTKSYHALDMKSANGVFVNGRKIDGDTELVDGDEIEIGKSKLLFTLEDFTDRDSAMNHWRQRGERGKSTLVK
jgi:pSer/pThr/pTyr-binding forkhead associated (FHA) protein